ncbi:inorganic phosphate transporter [Bailinhaonella thermotolerans]|uniref:Inorganic phosphate transporter n=1 Tax=Bailinhaonella thermotolerans TaxID=1070861 RepID=A0A3A4AX23_9ACTN|nr:inorganic phosphate transporter [Bailinhaonella thermotolerans]
MLEYLLLATAVLFVLITGVNDGGAVLAPAFREPRINLPAGGLLLVALVAVAPALFGTQVATTFVRRLVPFGGETGRIALAVAVLAALAVVLTLTWRGLPTSLTLALVGGLTGAGLGAGLPVSWGVVAGVLVAGLLAPFAGALLAYVLTGALALFPPSTGVSRTAYRAHWVAFPLLLFAYAVNDGQKMLAVLFAGTAEPGAAAGAVPARPWMLAATAGLFFLGLVIGLRRVGPTLGGALLPLRPLQLNVAQLATATAVIGSAAAGMPVSLTQSLAGAFVGAGLRQGYRRIRWQVAARIGAAWLFTLPSSLGLATLAGLLVRGIR